MNVAARRLLAVAAAAFVPLVAAFELAGHAAIAERVPNDAEWDRVADAARAGREPDELVVVAPRWAEPHARARLGDDAMPLAHLARADVSRFARATEISLHGERSPELSSFVERSAVAHGPFVVRRLDNPAVDPVAYDFVDTFGADVRVFGTDPPMPCVWSEREPVLSGGLAGHPTFPAARFVCPGGPFMTATVTVIADEKFLPRRCIYAHPFARNDKVLAWRDVPVGRAKRLVGHHGMYWVIERDGVGADVEIEARVDGATIGRARHRDGDGWASFAFELPPATPDARATVELAVRSARHEHRHYCLEATLR